MLMDAALDDRTRNRLRGWLDEQFETSPLVMVKDPRAAWASELWVDAAERVGGDVRFVTMLRHPVEVITSRRTYYAGERPASEMRAFAIRHLGGWINQNLTLESRNRDQRRVFLRYTDLLSDWRTSVARMLSELDLAEYSPTQRVDAEIDQFIDPALRRHQPDWDKLEVPSALSEIGKHAWTALGQLTRGSGRDSAVELTLDSIAATYSELYSDAEAICFDRTALRTRAAFESGRRQGSQEEVEKLAHTAKHDDATTSSGRISRAWLKRGLRWLRRTARRLVRQA